MKVEIWSDFSCPFCYIGKTTFENVLSTFEHKDQIEVVFKSYQLNPDAPDQTNEDSYTIFSKLKGMPLNQVKSVFMQTVNRAKEIGLTYNYDILQMTNTYKAHRLAKWARTKNKESELSSKLFEAYFTLGKNIHEDAVLLDIVASLNLDKDEAKKVLTTDAFNDVVQDELNEARQIGVSGVPFFVIDRKYAVSGAQPESLFKQALTQAYNEHKPFKTIGSDDAACGPDGCAI